VSDICNALEIPDLTKDPEFSTLSQQMSKRGEYRRRMSAGFSKFTTEECVRRLDKADILCCPVLPLGEVLQHPQIDENKIIVEINHPKHGNFRTVGNAIKSSAFPNIALKAPPLLGQHSEEILTEYGFSQDQIAKLFDSDVIAR
jgi:formyl-CoA transferase